jgi:hypothetical protein
MASANTPEERLAKIERELAELRHRVGIPNSKSHWITDMVGRFANDPVFDEIARLGKELRDAEDPNDAGSSEAKGKSLAKMRPFHD